MKTKLSAVDKRTLRGALAYYETAAEPGIDPATIDAHDDPELRKSLRRQLRNEQRVYQRHLERIRHAWHALEGL